MIQLTMETVGNEKLIRGFNRYVTTMKDFSEAFRQIGVYFYATEEKVFQQEGSPETFQQLSPAYEAWKKLRYPGRKIMELTGRLKASLTGDNQADAQDTVKVIRKMNAEFGTKVPYAHRHQMGTFGMPQRKIVQLTEVRKRNITSIIQRWSFEQMNNSLGFHDRQVR